MNNPWFEAPYRAGGLCCSYRLSAIVTEHTSAGYMRVVQAFLWLGCRYGAMAEWKSRLDNAGAILSKLPFDLVVIEFPRFFVGALPA